MPPGLRDSRLIDALETRTPVGFDGTLWRVVRETRDPTQCSASGGRWDDETFEVLYAAEAREGAIAELYFHLKRGQPVFPSRLRYRLHELHLSLTGLLDLSAAEALTDLGVDMARFGQLSYQERQVEYPRTQEVAEVAHFLDFSGVIVPSARWDCRNVVVFCDRMNPDDIEVVADHERIDWIAWEAAHVRR